MATAAPDDLYPVRRRNSIEWLPPIMSELKLVLLGNSWSERSSLGNLILGKTKFNTEEEPDKCLRVRAKIKEKDVFLINTPDLLSPNISKNELTDHVTDCVRLSDPGPHVFLLVLQPEEFTKEQNKKLRRILKRFSDQSLDQTLILIPREQDSDFSQSPAFRQLIRECRNRYLQLENLDHSELLTCLGQIVNVFIDASAEIKITQQENPRPDIRPAVTSGLHASKNRATQIERLVDENRGASLTFTEESMTQTPENMKPALNLVLCGRREAGKSSAAKAILGQTGLHSASTSSECVQHKGAVCGRWVSLVDLPALCGKRQETVMKESLRSVSLCDPEGVHAFILVLPVGHLTDEDKGELKIIQETFSSQVNDFTMILFTTESDPTDPAVVDFVEKNNAIQELVQNCGGRHFVLDINKEQQIPELLNMVEKMRLRVIKNKPCSFRTETFALAQTEKISSLQTELEDLKTRCPTSCDEVKQSSERLRIVLIGKTGNGKSSSGNTILGREEFIASANQTSVTRNCQKADGEVDGRPVAVVDTPGLFDNTFSHEEVHEEMIKCFNLLAPGPHVFLFVLHIGRFTEEEEQTLKLIKENFGKDAEKFTIVLLTGGDTLELEERSVEVYIETGCHESFKKLISDCGGRCHVLNNRDKGNREQVSELIKKIDTMVKTNGGSCFTNEMLQEAEAAIQKEMDKLMKKKEEEIRKGSQTLQRKHEEEMEERGKKRQEDEFRKKQGERSEEEPELRKKAEECNEFKEKHAGQKMGNEKLKKKQGGRCTIL